MPKAVNVSGTVPDGFTERARALAKARGKSISALVVGLFEKEAAREKEIRKRAMK